MSDVAHLSSQNSVQCGPPEFAAQFNLFENRDLLRVAAPNPFPSRFQAKKEVFGPIHRTVDRKGLRPLSADFAIALNPLLVLPERLSRTASNSFLIDP